MSIPPRKALLIVNTGSPAEPTPAAVKDYLAEFLSDRRVVELPPLFWQPILRWHILPRRCQSSAVRYSKVWTKEGSPLVSNTARIAAGLQQALGEDWSVRWAMCYGTDRVAEVLPEILAGKPERLVVLPLFPQYATQTTEAVFDAVSRAMRNFPGRVEETRIADYFEHPAYIKAVAGRVRAHWEAAGPLGPQDRLLISMHSIPLASIAKGSPYERQCRRTAELLASELKLDDRQWVLAFQSKFGHAKWLSPSAVDSARDLAAAGVGRLDVVCPGFAADCLETIEEIGIDLREEFLQAGGGAFHYIPCPNDAAEAVDAYAAIVRGALAGGAGA
jgi:ferrochelatase